jgi:hypothetical protein
VGIWTEAETSSKLDDVMYIVIEAAADAIVITYHHDYESAE